MKRLLPVLFLLILALSVLYVPGVLATPAAQPPSARTFASPLPTPTSMPVQVCNAPGEQFSPGAFHCYKPSPPYSRNQSLCHYQTPTSNHIWRMGVQVTPETNWTVDRLEVFLANGYWTSNAAPLYLKVYEAGTFYRTGTGQPGALITTTVNLAPWLQELPALQSPWPALVVPFRGDLKLQGGHSYWLLFETEDDCSNSYALAGKAQAPAWPTWLSGQIICDANGGSFAPYDACDLTGYGVPIAFYYHRNRLFLPLVKR